MSPDLGATSTRNELVAFGVQRELMEEYQVSRIMCTNSDGKIEGVISLSDVVDFNERVGARTLRQISQREVRRDSLFGR